MTEGTLAGRLLRAAERVRGLGAQIEAARVRHRSVDVAVRAVERDSEIGGSLLAGAIAYRLFVFLLPFALFLVGGLGIYADVTEQEPDELAEDVGITRAVAEQLASAANDTARWWLVLVSIPVLAYAIGQLYRSLAIVHALAYERSGRGARIAPRSVGLFGAAVLAQLVVVNVIGFAGERTPVGALLGALLAVALLTALWVGVSARLPHGSATWRERLPGAVLYAAGTVVLYLLNAIVIEWLIEAREDTYGALGAAAALLFSMYLLGRLIVAAAVLNAVAAEVRKP